MHLLPKNFGHIHRKTNKLWHLRPLFHLYTHRTECADRKLRPLQAIQQDIPVLYHDFGLPDIFSTSTHIAQSELAGSFGLSNIFDCSTDEKLLFTTMSQHELYEAFWRTPTHEVGDNIYLAYSRLPEEILGYRPYSGIKSLPLRVLNKSTDNMYRLDFSDYR
jgi:hypothetical protein